MSSYRILIRAVASKYSPKRQKQEPDSTHHPGLPTQSLNYFSTSLPCLKTQSLESLVCAWSRVSFWLRSACCKQDTSYLWVTIDSFQKQHCLKIEYPLVDLMFTITQWTWFYHLMDALPSPRRRCFSRVHSHHSSSWPHAEPRAWNLGVPRDLGT